MVRNGPSISVQTRTITLAGDSGFIAMFDHSGRLLSLCGDGNFVVRGVSGRMKRKSWASGGDQFDRIITELSMQEKDRIIARVKRELTAAAAAVGHAPTQALASLLTERVEGLAAEETRFSRVYLPIPILPPDQYFPVVLQVTEGCPWNRCTYCAFYRDRAFRIRSKEEIRAHANAVAEFLGKGVSMRDSVFFADANAFVMETGRLIETLDIARSRFPEQMEQHRGAFSFADVPAILAKSPLQIRMIARAGLRRLYVGLESGCDEIRRAIKKPASASDAVRAIRAFREGGIEAGVIVMLGLGGQEQEASHISRTVEALNALELGPSDIVYFSPFHPAQDSEYVSKPAARGWTPLSRSDLRAQYQKMREGLKATGSFRSRCGLYHIEESLY